MTRASIGLLLLALTLPARAATTLNLKDADINTLIATVSEVTGKNFIVDERVKGKVTVISSRAMSAEGVYETFLAVLAIKGYAAVPMGEAIKIVPEANAKSDGGARIHSGSGLPDDDIVTHVYQIENVSAAQLVPMLRSLVPQWAHLAAYGPSNMLIISDRAANVQRLEKIIKQIDQTGDREIELVKLQYASASETVRILTTLTQQDKQADASVKPAALIADERTNSILVGGDKAERQKLLAILAQLDTPLAEDGATQVVYLRYASAENLAPILEGYAQQADTAGTAPAGGKAPPAPSGGVTGSRIIADKDANALVITASPKTLRAIKNVIAQLDIKRSQVLVEAVIAEVSAQKSHQLGIDWAVFNDNRIAAAGIMDPSTLSALAAAATAVASPEIAFLGAAAGQGLTSVAGADNRPGGTSFGLLIKALQGDGDTNVLSTPSLVATDNEESEISVGQEVPFVTGNFTNTGTGGGTGTVNPFQTIQRKDVGLTLGITPQINAGDSIQLKLNLEVSTLAAGVTGAADLITNKRTLTTTVSVNNGQILVLGGLIDDNVQDTERGIPFLSSIPLIGSLFQFRSIRKEKRNLMVFIRPAILSHQAEADYYTRRKYESVRESQIELINNTKPTPLPLPKEPVLPEYEVYQKDQLRGTPPPPADAPPASEPAFTPAPDQILQLPGERPAQSAPPEAGFAPAPVEEERVPQPVPQYDRPPQGPEPQDSSNGRIRPRD